MMELTASDLRYFLEVANSLNMSRAAERLGVGQPTVSQAMKRLEQGMGVPLLDRFKTGVRLTPAGKRLVHQGRLFLESISKLKEEVSSEDAEIRGHYLLGCHPSVAIYSLPVFLKDLMGSHLDLRMDLKHGLSRTITEEVINFKLDFGIVVNPIRHPDLVIRELCTDQVGFWSAPDSLKDTLILDPSLTQCQKLVREMEKRGRVFKRRIESENLEVIAALAESGCGVAILPERVAKRNSKLARAERGLPVLKDRIALIFRADRRMTAAARTIIDSVLKAGI